MPEMQFTKNDVAEAAEATNVSNDPTETADTRKARFAARFYAAVRRRDAAKILKMAKAAGSDGNLDAVRPLSDFLVPPNSHWNVRRWRKPEWQRARSAAAWALGQLDDPATYSTLATVMICDPDPIVREAAATAIGQAGVDAIPVLVSTMRTENDWRLEGMKVLITRLGNSAGLSEAARRNVGMALIDVLYENFPIAPRRYMKPAREFGRVVAILVSLALTINYVVSGWFWPFALGAAWILGQIAGVGAKMLMSVFTAGLQSPAEYGQLYPVAAQSLVQLNDKRAIPGMLQLAFLTPLSKTWRHARKVLLALLPLIESADAGLFSTSDVEIMNGAVTQSLDLNLTLALLHALEFVGTGSTIRPVTRLAKGWGHPAIKAEATRVAGILQAKEARLKMSKNLLRGSQSPAAEPTEMLRAATLQQEQRPELLLRPLNETTGTDAHPTLNINRSNQQ